MALKSETVVTLNLIELFYLFTQSVLSRLQAFGSFNEPSFPNKTILGFFSFCPLSQIFVVDHIFLDGGRCLYHITG